MPRVWYLRTKVRLTWWWALLRKPVTRRWAMVNAALGLPPAPAVRRTAGLRPLPAAESTQRVAVGLRVWVLCAVTINGQGSDADVRASHGLVFSVGDGAMGGFQLGDAGVPAAVTHCGWSPREGCLPVIGGSFSRCPGRAVGCADSRSTGRWRCLRQPGKSRCQCGSSCGRPAGGPSGFYCASGSAFR